MSKVLEYLKLLPEGFRNREYIGESIWNNIKMEFNTLPEDEKEEILRRRLICESCPLMSLNVKENQREYIELIGESLVTNRNEKFCTLCSCNISLKTSSLDSNCGAKSFNEGGKGKRLAEVKWENYKKV